MTGHHDLCWLKSMQEGSEKLTIWIIELSKYRTKHLDADYLSRYR